MSGALDYKIVQASEPHILESSVKKWVEQGWLPVGGVTIFTDNIDPEFTSYTFLQAMIIHSDD